MLKIKYVHLHVEGDFPSLNLDDLRSIAPMSVIVRDIVTDGTEETDNNFWGSLYPMPDVNSSGLIKSVKKPELIKVEPAVKNTMKRYSVSHDNLLFKDYIFNASDDNIISEGYDAYREFIAKNRKTFGWLLVGTIVSSFIIQFASLFVFAVGIIIISSKNASRLMKIKNSLDKVISYKEFVRIAEIKRKAERK